MAGQGNPKTGGRQKGTPNKRTTALSEALDRQIENQRFFKMARGGKREGAGRKAGGVYFSKSRLSR